jgi:hypothetical protein
MTGIRHPSEQQLLNYRAGRQLAGVLREHIEGCEACRSRVEALGDEWQSSSATLVPERLIDCWLDKRRRTSNRWRLQPMRWAPAVAVALVLIVALPRLMKRPDGARVKGAPAVQVYVKRGDTVSRAPPGFVFERGDLVRIGIESPFPVRVSIATGEAPGQRPIPELTDLPIAAGEEVVLPGSLALGCETGRERVDLRLVDPSGAKPPLVRTLVLPCSR